MDDNEDIDSRVDHWLSCIRDFAMSEIGEMAGVVLVECCHANRFNVLEIINQ